MLNSGKKINILPLMLSEENFLNEIKNHNPPFKLNGRSLRQLLSIFFTKLIFFRQLLSTYFSWNHRLYIAT